MARLELGRISRMVGFGVGAVAVAVACSSSSPTTSSPPAGTPPGSDGGAASGTVASAVIGPNGGRVATADGVAAVDVPEGALAADVTITITPVAAHPPMVLTYEFGPDGTRFAQPVTLSFARPSRAASPGDENSEVVMTVENGEPVALHGGVDWETGRLFGLATHFSLNGVGPGGKPCACIPDPYKDCCEASRGSFAKAGSGAQTSCLCVSPPFVVGPLVFPEVRAYNRELRRCMMGEQTLYGAGCSSCMEKCCTDAEGYVAGEYIARVASRASCICTVFDAAHSRRAESCFRRCIADGETTPQKPECGGGGDGGVPEGGTPPDGGSDGGNGTTSCTGAANGACPACNISCGPSEGVAYCIPAGGADLPPYCTAAQCTCRPRSCAATSPCDPGCSVTCAGNSYASCYNGALVQGEGCRVSSCTCSLAP